MKISILDTGIHTAKENMDIDKTILNNLDTNGCPILHLYAWKGDCLTYGYFAKPDQLLDFSGLDQYHIQCAKRITGGGVTLHFTDLAFSFFMPSGHPAFSENTLQNYAFVNQRVASALEKFVGRGPMDYFETQGPTKKEDAFFFCMAKPTRYDVMVKGKKIGGAAQRRTQQGYLHHGTISLACPDPQILRAILKDKDGVYQAVLKNSFYLIPNHLQKKELSSLRKEASRELIRAFQET